MACIVKHHLKVLFKEIQFVAFFHLPYGKNTDVGQK